MWLVSDSQRVLPPGGSGLVSDGCHGGTLSPHVPMQSWSIEEALGVKTSTDKMEVEVLPHMAKSSVGVLIDNSTVWTKGQLPAPFTDSKQLPHKTPMPVEGRQQELLVCATRHSRGTTAVNQGAPVLTKEDRAMGRYLSKPSQVYRGTQSAIAVNWSGAHSTRRPSSQRIGSQ